MSTRCGYASRYKGQYRPTCLGGRGCDACREKYEAVMASKWKLWRAQDAARATKKGAGDE